MNIVIRIISLKDWSSDKKKIVPLISIYLLKLLTLSRNNYDKKARDVIL